MQCCLMYSTFGAIYLECLALDLPSGEVSRPIMNNPGSRLGSAVNNPESKLGSAVNNPGSKLGPAVNTREVNWNQADDRG